MGGMYCLLAIFCRFYFYHHPSHIGVKISSNKRQITAGNFFLDATPTERGRLTPS
jgi:hypothetical protein